MQSSDFNSALNFGDNRLNSYIEVANLRELLDADPDNVLILDCRSFISYNEDNIITACNVNCPPIVLRRSRGCLPIENTVPCQTRRERLQKGEYKKIIAYDESSDAGDISSPKSPGNIMAIAISSLTRQGYNNNNEIASLNGGFARFRKLCPHLCRSFGGKDQAFQISTNLPQPHSAKNTLKSLTKSQPVELLPHLYIGDSTHATNKDILNEYGITALLNVSTTCKNVFPDEFLYKVIPVDDNSVADMSFWFQEAIAFIDEVKKLQGRVLVHCYAGISRSATICLAYIMNSKRLTLDTAFDFVKSKRNVISPNLNFMQQLMEFERTIIPAGVKKGSSPPLLSPRSPCRLAAFNPSITDSMLSTSPLELPHSPFLSPTLQCSPLLWL